MHRIDKDTSGLLVVAKSDAAHHGLAAQFEAHTRRAALPARWSTACPTRPTRGCAGIKGVSFEPGGVVKITTQLARHKTDRQRQAVSGRAGATR